MSDLITFWFSHSEIWFNSTPKNDQIITERFGHLLLKTEQQIQSQTPHPDIAGIINRSDKDELLHTILLYDQIVRHVFRGDDEKIKELSRYAFEVAMYVLDHNLDREYLPQERCFILIPLRHTFDLKFMEMVLDKVKEYRAELDSPYYIRFYKATVLAMSKIKTPLIIPEEVNNSILNEDIFNSLDPNCVKNLDTISDINRSEPIYNAFLNTFNTLNTLNRLNRLNRLNNRRMQAEMRGGDEDRDIKEITLSLSGGVDSMISSFNLYHLSNRQERFKIIAVTIDYGNREDHQFEIEFVKRWCRLLGITHYVKHITELRRNRAIDRDLYEKLTRTMRFDMYRRFENPVILGHNLDDCLENIFNNIKKTRSLNNLRGMNEFAEEEGCLIVRPMLNISKQDIRAFARKYMIPHLPNSTPSWSERGRIRDELVPAINQFDIALIPGMIKLADNMKQMYDIYNISAVERFYNENIEFGISNVSIHLVEDAPEKQYGFIFWKDIICRIFKRLDEPEVSLSLPSNKSIRACTQRISNNQYGQIKVSNKTTFHYTSSNLILNIIKNKENI